MRGVLIARHRIREGVIHFGRLQLGGRLQKLGHARHGVVGGHRPPNGTRGGAPEAVVILGVGVRAVRGRSGRRGLHLGIVGLRVHLVRRILPSFTVVPTARAVGLLHAPGELGDLTLLLLLLALEALLATQVAPVLEHVPRVGVQRPKGSLARLVGSPRNLDEAVVEGERVADRVLPALLVLPVVGE